MKRNLEGVENGVGNRSGKNTKGLNREESRSGKQSAGSGSGKEQGSGAGREKGSGSGKERGIGSGLDQRLR